MVEHCSLAEAQDYARRCRGMSLVSVLCQQTPISPPIPHAGGAARDTRVPSGASGHKVDLVVEFCSLAGAGGACATRRTLRNGLLELLELLLLFLSVRSCSRYALEL
jgi:hypothetical protein